MALHSYAGLIFKGKELSMRFIHLSDLHIGKRLNGFSLLEDQEYILLKIIEIIDDKKPQAVIIAGDVYDKSVPSAEAVALFDSFLVRLLKRNIEVFVISGNHDSAERIAFGSKIMDAAGIHMSPVYAGHVEPVELRDEYGSIFVYSMPFIKPVNVRKFFGEDIESYDDAMKAAVEEMGIDKNARNVIVTHQFVTGAERSESEEITVGGTDNIDAGIFGDFDYVALGHIHKPQMIGREEVRYCGTPLKYSFSEAGHEKSVTVVDMNGKGDIDISKVPLVPVRDLRIVKGNFDEVMAGEISEDYMQVILTDEEDIFDAVNKLRNIYPNIMKLDYDNRRTRSQANLDVIENIEELHPAELFAQFYEEQNGQPMSEEQEKYVKDLVESIWRA